MKAGDTVFPLDPSLREPHLVMTDPDSLGRIAVVNPSTRRSFSDACCLLQPGAHPFVIRETVAMYQSAVLAPDSTLEMWVREHRVERRQPASAALLLQIRRGAVACEMTRRDVKAAVEASLA